MSTKKIIPVLLMAFCISFASPTFATKVTPPKTEVPKEVRAQQIEHRLIEIKQRKKI
jgi:hypothetical protein